MIIRWLPISGRSAIIRTLPLNLTGRIVKVTFLQNPARSMLQVNAHLVTLCWAPYPEPLPVRFLLGVIVYVHV